MPSISGIQLRDRTWVDKMNFILPAEGGQDFLVNTKESCQGTRQREIDVRNGKKNVLGKNDRFVTRYEQSVVDNCFVQAIYRLDPA